jgi:trehalose 6-phosphate phosphatase
VIDSSLREALTRVARAGLLVVASDYDGTLSPIVEDPAAAVPLDAALGTLFEISESPTARVVIVSGRSHATLGELTGAPDTVTLVGDHGAEVADPPDPDAFDALIDAMEDVAARFPGAEAERKSHGVALHYRRAADPDGAARAALDTARRFDGRLIEGKKVVEVVLADGDKGSAIASLRDRWGADAVVFFGDDTTDEDVFAVMGDADVGVKVGEGPTLAAYRVADPHGVAEALGILRGALDAISG